MILSVKKNHLFLAFIPWIFFALLYGNTHLSALIGSGGALLLMVLFDFRELAKLFILPWGSVLLFGFLLINNLHEFVALSTIGALRLINSTLAAIVIFSLLIGRPFTLQYAREEVDSKYWKNPNFIKINWILTSIWAVLMIVMALPSYFLSYEVIHESWFWSYGLMILCILVGVQCNRRLPKLLRK